MEKIKAEELPFPKLWTLFNPARARGFNLVRGCVSWESLSPRGASTAQRRCEMGGKWSWCGAGSAAGAEVPLEAIGSCCAGAVWVRNQLWYVCERASV